MATAAKKRLVSSFLAVTMTLFVPGCLFAAGSGGISNEVTSAEGLSTLYGATGSKIDPLTIYNQPAAIGDQGRVNSTVGVSYFNFSAKKKGPTGNDKMKTGESFVPNAGVTGNIGKFGWGVAEVSPYGLETEWSDTSSVRYVATKSTLKMFDITPAVSYRACDILSFGVGADYFNTFNADLEKKLQIDVLNFVLSNGTVLPSGLPDGSSKLTGDGHGWGYHAGVTFNPAPNHTIGIAYHSEVKTKIEGDLEVNGLSGPSALAFGGTSFKTHMRTDLFYPQNVQLGYKYTANEDKWSAGLALAWYDWSSNKELKINLPNAPAQQALIAPIPLQWRDVWSVNLGGHYRFNEAWKLNMSAYYLPRVYQESTFSPAVPDMNKIGIVVGPGYQHGDWGVDAFYNPLFYKTTNINNTVGQSNAGAGGDISGKYSAMVHIVGVNVRYRYGGEKS